MKKFIIAIAVMLVSATAVSAQNYNSAIGLEGGFDGIGLTYKNWNSDNTFMDYKANLDLNKHHMGLWASATKDWNVVLGNNFSFFYGLGAALGADFYESSAYFRAAVFGNLGFEY